jgi:hypothetical protein
MLLRLAIVALVALSLNAGAEPTRAPGPDMVVCPMTGELIPAECCPLSKAR